MLSVASKVFKLSVIILNVIMLCVIMLNVVAPQYWPLQYIYIYDPQAIGIVPQIVREQSKEKEEKIEKKQIEMEKKR